ncbi:fimbrial protein [Pseudomonas sp. MPC6]|uniref:fimbrial protein n=1 Tax=unclassified Pseudomonas TaxID=196821 RepID=UPI0011105A60|nr:fimbrial protein [Pseudomonas sp. MPC6]QCY12724.1 type 1 fimbrial protein [Pseudomonas sp. MPC6]
MNATIRHLTVLTALAVGPMAQSAVAASDEANGCHWGTAPGPMTFNVDVGTVYVPRDARSGSLIGTFDRYAFTRNAEGLSLECFNDGNHRLRFEASSIAPVFSGTLPPINGEDVNGKVLETGINNGIGARIRLGFPYSGDYENEFRPIGPPVVPFAAEVNHSVPSSIPLNSLTSHVTLIKIGPIAPGTQVFNSRLFSGSVTGLNTIFNYQIRGTVIQSQCTVLGNPVSANPVDLGTWPASDFTHKNYGTTPIPFDITLSDCESDPNGGNVATAHIRLDGAKGSVHVDDGSNGVFTLGNGSTASGMGIQIMLEDGITPVPLGTQVSLKRIEPTGATKLPFTARFFQTENSVDIRGGVAKGALSFTVTYQ